MEIKHLHIISLEIPYPPIRGNVMGIFNRIKALHEAGISITLHAFYKKLNFPAELAPYCKTIFLYRRKPIWKVTNLDYPLFVQSRRAKSIMDVLLRDQDPILFEGLHTLYHFDNAKIKDRKKFIRMHNIESNYYGHLADNTPSLFKKIYYRWESNESKKLEAKLLIKANAVFAISKAENEYFKNLNITSHWIPPFHSHLKIQSISGSGPYALYHGDLSIRENEDAALFLIDHVFSKLNFPLVIAGHQPSAGLIKKLWGIKNIRLISSPSQVIMNQLIQEAHIILLPFSQTSGYKMKMIDSMALGRHIITSQIMSVHSELNDLVYFAGTPAEDWIQTITELIPKPFTDLELNKRKELFETILENKINAQKIIDQIFPG